MHHPFPFEVFEITHAAIRYDLLHQRTLQLSVASLHPFVNQKLAQNFRENVHHKVLNASYLTSDKDNHINYMQWVRFMITGSA